LQRSPFIRE